ncbi:MAG: VWA domain-containing protein [Kiritimatiellia bacterium]
MILRHPLMLLCLLLIPAMVYFRHFRRRRPILLFSSGELLSKLPASWAVRASILLPVLYALALVLIVIAMSRPQKGMDESVVRTDAVDIVLLVDTSTSMNAEDLASGRNRLDVAKVVIEEFVKARESDRLGMVAFSAMPYTVAPLTLDHGWLLQRLQMLRTGMLEDGTAIGDALASAINRLRDSEAKSKVVILLTDGMNNAGELTPENAAQAAKALGIKVYTIGAGSTSVVQVPFSGLFGGPQYIQQQAEIDEPTLRMIGDTTGGMYFRAQDIGELQKVYDQIDKLEKTEMEVEQYTRFEERFAGFALGGLLLLALGKLLSLTRLGRHP